MAKHWQWKAQGLQNLRASRLFVSVVGLLASRSMRVRRRLRLRARRGPIVDFCSHITYGPSDEANGQGEKLAHLGVMKDCWGSERSASAP